MKLKDFINIHYESGYTLKKIEDLYFYNRGIVNYSFPPLAEIKLTNKLIHTLKWRYLISVIKTEHRIKNNYEYILKTESYDIDEFRKKTRTTIRKSLKTCVFKKPSFKDMMQEGLLINRQTLKIQKRQDKYLSDRKLWEPYISHLFDNESVMIMGAYVDEKMIGYAITYELEGKQYFHLQHINRDYGTYYPMSGLMYVIVNQWIYENGAIEISDGIESFCPLPSLNRFKTYMRFDRTPITRVYVIHPVVLAIFKMLIFYYIRILKKKSIKNQWFKNIITLYQGHRTLSKIMAESFSQKSRKKEYMYHHTSSEHH